MSLIAAAGLLGLAGPATRVDAMARQASPQGTTIVRVSFVGPEGEPATVTRAQLLLAAWGEAEILPLTCNGNTLSVDLSESKRPGWASGFEGDFRAYLFVEADGFAPILSQPFDWVRPGKTEPVAIDFGQGRRATVRDGRTTDLVVPLRRPVPRRVRLVDVSGAPFPGVNVNAAVFWTNDNHCGVINTDLEVGSARSDESGWLTLPDGEFEYALRVESGDMVLPHRPSLSGGHETIVALTESQALVAHRTVRRALRLTALRRGRGVPGLELFSELADCGCGACGGREGVTDAAGVIARERWPQEILGNMWLCEGDREVWRGSAKDVPAGDFQIVLPPTAPKAGGRCSARPPIP